jgi:hypothetical protein
MHPSLIGLGRESEVCAALLDLNTIIKLVATCPTHVYELLEQPLLFVGMVGTSSTGVGGIWLLPLAPYTVYWHQWLMHIQKHYRDAELTTSSLEMAGMLVVWFILEASVHLHHTSTTVLSDNSPTVSWTQKLMSSSDFRETHQCKATPGPSHEGPNFGDTGPNHAPLGRKRQQAGQCSFPLPLLTQVTLILRSTTITLSKLFQLLFPPSTGRLLATADNTPNSTLAADLDAGGWTAIATATVDLYPPSLETDKSGEPIVPSRVKTTPTLRGLLLSEVPSWWGLLPDTVHRQPWPGQSRPWRHRGHCLATRKPHV